MDFAGEQYYKLNRFLLLSLGLWPYQSSILKKIQMVFFQTLFVSFLLCQFNVFLVRQCSVDLFIKVITFVVINGVYIIKYNAFLLLTDNIRYIFDSIRHDWNMLKSQAELKIIQQYATLATITLLGYIGINCVPIVLDVIVPMDESRPRPFIIIMEFYVDQNTYFYPILTYSFLVNYAGCITIVAVASILIAYTLHVCALFKITSYRIERIFDKGMLQKDIKRRILYEKLICAVYIHRRAMGLNNILTSSFATFYFILLGFGVALVSFSLYRFFNAVIALDDTWELLFCISLIIFELYYIFLGNYVSQDVIDTSVKVCQITYSTQWYTAPLWMQKSLLLVMQRSGRKSALTAGGLFHASLEGFAMIMNTSISYVMLLISMRAQQRKPQGEL